MAEARDRGIAVFECYSTDVADGEANGLYSQCGGAESVALSADRLADWVIEDSGGDANVVAVTIRDFPILVAEEDAVAAAFDEHAPRLLLDAVPVTVEDLGAGEVPQQVASYIQSNPRRLRLVHVLRPVARRLRGARRCRRARGPQPRRRAPRGSPSWKSSPPGPTVAGPPRPTSTPCGSWRIRWPGMQPASGMPRWSTRPVLPAWVVEDQSVAEELLDTGAGGWPGPDGYQDHFRELWGLS